MCTANSLSTIDCETLVPNGVVSVPVRTVPVLVNVVPIRAVPVLASTMLVGAMPVPVSVVLEPISAS